MEEEKGLTRVLTKADVETMLNSLPPALTEESICNAVSVGISSAITKVLESPQLAETLNAITRGNAISGMLSGLVAADGRKGLDARVIGQNAIEIGHAIEHTMKYLQKRLDDINSGENSGEVQDGEDEYQKWKEEQASLALSKKEPSQE